MSKNDSMLAILWMLSSGEKVTAKQIAEKLEINIRTVYRYIDSLSASGVPIIADKGHGGGYSLLNSFVNAPLVFDIDEQKALFHAAVFAKESGYPFSGALISATNKLKRYSNKYQEDILNRHLLGLDVINSNFSGSRNEMLEMLEEAAASGFSVEIIYKRKNSEKKGTRIIDPYGIIYWKNKWYTVGFCHFREEIRSFRADRILDIKPLDSSFKRPEEFSIREFFMGGLLPDFNEGDKIASLVISGNPESIDDLCAHWFLSHYIKERTEDKVIFSLDERIMDLYLPNFILHYGKSVKVMEPESFNRNLEALAYELMKYYQD